MSNITMDMTSTVESFEEVLMYNPLGDSEEIIDGVLTGYSFEEQVYPEEVWKRFINPQNLKKKVPTMPKVVFLPSKKLLRIIIDANIKFARKESEALFLLRFGIVENIQFHLSQSTE